jgi:hypothetical protein
VATELIRQKVEDRKYDGRRTSKIIKAIDSLSNIPYSLGGEEGIDCLRMINLFLNKTEGYTPPVEFGGLSITSYPEKYNENSTEVMAIYCEYIRHVCNKIDYRLLFLGDIIIGYCDDGSPDICIACGNDLVLTCTSERGTFFTKLSAISIGEVFRGVKIGWDHQ